MDERHKEKNIHFIGASEKVGHDETGRDGYI